MGKFYPVPEPTPCYNKEGKQIGWFNPRFLATAVFVFAWSESNKEWCVLGSVRGKGAESFKGEINCPCGYMTINVNTKENAVKELQEECGLTIEPEKLTLMDIEDDPQAYGQHVTFRFMTVLKDVNADTVKFSHDGNEIDENGNLEVGDIMFIPLSKINTYKWAFGHNKVIMKYAKINNFI